MIRLKNDYAEGAHGKVLEALCRTNLEQADGYGEDQFCEKAGALLRRRLGRPCDIHFLAGGTQVNLALLSHVLLPYQAVIAADTGHISTHEAGAVEATGHKVIEMPHLDGKLTPEAVSTALRENAMGPHTVQPRVVYISQPTELGTLYSREELASLARLCKEENLLLYADGARLACALAAQKGELGLADYADLCDAFTIGGTKCGALLGEALVISNPSIAPNFRYIMKQKGAMLSKGRVLGTQFAALFEDGLYEEIGAHANAMAEKIRAGLAGMGISFFIESPTNQQFPILPAQAAQVLVDDGTLLFWADAGNGRTALRCVTSWATTERDVEEFLTKCRKIL